MTVDSETSESGLVSMVREAARMAGWCCYHTRGSGGSETGFPDLVLVGGGKVIFAEMKAVGGRVSRVQADWLDDLKAAGADARLVIGHDAARRLAAEMLGADR